jgi:hypothetical protein
VTEGVLVAVEVVPSVWLPVAVGEPVPKNVAVSIGVLVAVPGWLTVLD